MDTFKIKAVFNKYKKILGGDCDNSFSQDNEEMLAKVTGSASLVNNIGFLLNVIEHIDNEKFAGQVYENLYDELKADNEGLAEKLKLTESLIDTYNKCYVQQAKLKTGVKIAYKEKASKEEVYKLKMAGLSYEQIKKRLGVSESTIRRRLKDIDSDN
ncbi:helix-turn-helix transcriptional regulator [Clostridium sp.]|uniref:helix-turn-helix transcriptional regulator n=1 Tax=Clostridium sp. TaxID=1506 RepID=UPI003D6C72C2